MFNYIWKIVLYLAVDYSVKLFILSVFKACWNFLLHQEWQQRMRTSKIWVTIHVYKNWLHLNTMIHIHTVLNWLQHIQKNLCHTQIIRKCHNDSCYFLAFLVVLFTWLWSMDIKSAQVHLQFMSQLSWCHLTAVCAIFEWGVQLDQTPWNVHHSDLTCKTRRPRVLNFLSIKSSGPMVHH